MTQPGTQKIAGQAHNPIFKPHSMDTGTRNDMGTSMVNSTERRLLVPMVQVRILAAEQPVKSGDKITAALPVVPSLW